MTYLPTMEVNNVNRCFRHFAYNLDLPSAFGNTLLGAVLLTNFENMKVVERRIVRQEWYETETTKTGWDSHGWIFDNGHTMGNAWTIVQHIHLDKFGNPFVGVAEREVDV